MKRKKQQWKVIKGFQGKYQISSYGRIKRKQHTVSFRRKNNSKKNPKIIDVDRTFEQRILNPSFDNCGYYHVRLYMYGRKAKIFKVHRLVAKYFLPDYSQELTVDHIDFDKRNNNVDNLRMVTKEQNLQFYKDKYHRMRVYKSSDGEFFCQFRRYCKKKNIEYSRYFFMKSVLKKIPYKDTGITFSLVDQGKED